jgi:hypothetical protein
MSRMPQGKLLSGGTNDLAGLAIGGREVPGVTNVACYAVRHYGSCENPILLFFP